MLLNYLIYLEVWITVLGIPVFYLLVVNRILGFHIVSGTGFCCIFVCEYTYLFAFIMIKVLRYLLCMNRNILPLGNQFSKNNICLHWKCYYIVLSNNMRCCYMYKACLQNKCDWFFKFQKIYLKKHLTWLPRSFVNYFSM